MQLNGRGAGDEHREAEMRYRQLSPPGLTVGMVRERWYVREGGEGGGYWVREWIQRKGRRKPTGVEGVTLRSWGGEPSHFRHQHFFHLPSLSLPLRAQALSLDLPADVVTNVRVPHFLSPLPSHLSLRLWLQRLLCVWMFGSFLPPCCAAVDLLSRAAPAEPALLRAAESEACGSTQSSPSHLLSLALHLAFILPGSPLIKLSPFILLFYPQRNAAVPLQNNPTVECLSFDQVLKNIFGSPFF